MVPQSTFAFCYYNYLLLDSVIRHLLSILLYLIPQPTIPIAPCQNITAGSEPDPLALPGQQSCVCSPGCGYFQPTSSCVVCDYGTFKAEASNAVCSDCQGQFIGTTETGSKSSEDCVCKNGYVMVGKWLG